ncbi:hypothetical protein, partial [Gemmatimonas sp.]
MRFFGVLASLGLGLAAGGGLAACAAISRPPATLASLEQDAARLADRDRVTRDSVVERLARR